MSEAVFRALERKGWLTIEAAEVARDPFAGETFLPTTELVLNAEQRLAVEAIKEAIETPAPPSVAFRRDWQREDGNLSAGHSACYRSWPHRARPRSGDFPHSANRRKIQGALCGCAAGSGGSSQPSLGEANASTNGARFIPARRASSSGREAPSLRRSTALESSSSMRSTKALTSRKRRLAITLVMSPFCGRSGRGAPWSWAAQLLPWKVGTMCGPENTDCCDSRQRVDDRRMPVIRVLDMRRAPRLRRSRSHLRACAVGRHREDGLADGEQTILFLNRRGFSTTMLCQACGHVCKCPNCSVALTYHRDAAQLACHICGHQERAPKACPACKDPGIRHSGVGTQKVEDAVKRIFPKARVARMDADAMTRKNAYHQTLQAFKEGAIDILVGTQMIAKGLHFPNVTLVGIINADLSLHLPDFRAGERTFQLLTQVAGRAGRGERRRRGARANIYAVQPIHSVCAPS